MQIFLMRTVLALLGEGLTANPNREGTSSRIGDVLDAPNLGFLYVRKYSFWATYLAVTLGAIVFVNIWFFNSRLPLPDQMITWALWIGVVGLIGLSVYYLGRLFGYAPAVTHRNERDLAKQRIQR